MNQPGRRARIVIAIIAAAALAAATITTIVVVNSNGAPPVTKTTASIIPAPVSQTNGDGHFTLDATTTIGTTTIDTNADAASVATYLADVLTTTTGLTPAIGDSGNITLAIEPGQPAEGYTLAVAPDSIRLSASEPAGLFWGVQSLRQLLHESASARSSVEMSSANSAGSGEAKSAGSGGVNSATAAWAIPATTITDHPRFAYRGAMLDVARHFFGVDDVKRYIDDIATLKINVLHLHLTDDQGWRLAIDGWPQLTEYGATTQVGGGGGGYYTQDDYREIVDYAATRFITIVPEIDMPGHTNAALASYPELTCDGVAPPLYEGIEVGFSSLCINHERTYEFIEDVVTQLVALTPGPWIHIGGDESLATPEADFLAFVDRVSAIVAAHGKTVIGWHEMGRSTNLPSGTIGEYWSYVTPQGDAAQESQNFIDNGGKLILSPADVAYLDMKYDDSSPLGLVWANGPTSVQESYSWEPTAILPGVSDDALLGVEAPLWTETIVTMNDLESMVFPRLASISEIAWSPKRVRDFAEFAPRLADFGTYLDSLGIHFERATGVPWH